jgi:hypothetical protein
MTTLNTYPSLACVAFPSHPSFTYVGQPQALVASEGYRVFITTNIRVEKMTRSLEAM